jgi:hypothetical protein
MTAIQHKWVITNGILGTFDTQIVRYSTHSNGRRALSNAIQEHADRTKRPSWAETWEAYCNPNPNHYYTKYPNN